MAPLAPQKKVLVSKDFLDTEHGALDCDDCHRGNSDAKDKDTAHLNMRPQPSLTNAEYACGGCHPDIVETAQDSLHATLKPFTSMLKARAGKDKWEHVDRGRENHCASCHTSCGGCHVSRPAYVKKGFIDGHNFNATPDIVNQCMACHGSRVGNEFIGLRGQGDTHAHKYNMGCIACHKDGEMHAAAKDDIKDRYDLPEAVQCKDCHQDLENGSILDHAVHKDKVQCQVCHSQPYTNCYSCHLGVDDDGIPYYQNRKDEENFKIGLNPDKSANGAPYKYMLVRHIPADPKAFDHYAEGAMGNFSALPTWKRTSPHNIQRKTWQNANCNNCHGNRDLFLSQADLLDYEKEANKAVVVPDNLVPGKIAKTKPLNIDTSSVQADMIVSAKWLADNMAKPSMVIVDARASDAYKGGHIKDAVNIDPIAQLRWPWNSKAPQELINPEDLAKIFADLGMSNDSHIIVYDKDGWRAGFLASVLLYTGAENVSYLDGGLNGWLENGGELTDQTPEVEKGQFKAKAHKEWIADNEYVQKNLDYPLAVVVDARTLDQSKGVTKHPQALRGGRIPGSEKLPVASFYKDHAGIRSPEEMLWLLKSRRITPNKEVIVTCNTGAWAGGAFFIFKYLGYDNVRLHDSAWVSWCSMDKISY